MQCPYSGRIVSNAQSCPEFNGGGGGGGGCASRGNCATDEDDDADGPDLTGADEQTEKATDCISTMARSRNRNDLVGTDLDGAQIEFFFDQEHQLGGQYARTVRRMDHPTIGAGRGPNEFAIGINRTFIRQDAETRGVSYQRLLTDVMSHEYTHVKKFLDNEDQPRPHVYGDSVGRRDGEISRMPSAR